MSARLRDARRLVIKIGSALLVEPVSGSLHRDWLDALADDIADCHDRDQEVVVVSSGAIALGRRRLKLKRRGGLKLEESQAAAATGQIGLAHAYQEALARHDLKVAQILLTVGDIERRRSYLNAGSTIRTLLRLGVMPVINENDSVATSEIRFGDNDRLAALVAQMISADCLVLLSDIDGLYSADPRREPDARPLPEVAEITPEIEAMAAPAGPGDSSGGMVSKLSAARIAIAAGCHMAIADGTARHPLSALLEGARCTWFVPHASPRAARKQWIGGLLEPAGRLTIDDGAARALAAGKSLLPAGVTSVEGDFERGDPVLVAGPDGAVLGRGLCAYSAKHAHRIMGHKSRETEALLGYRGRDEIIHRDDLVLN